MICPEIHLPKFHSQVRIIRAHVDSGRSFGRQAPGSLEENKAAGAFHVECVIDFFFDLTCLLEPRTLRKYFVTITLHILTYFSVSYFYPAGVGQ